MKEKIIKNLTAVKNAFESYKKSFRWGTPCEKLFKNFTKSLKKELGEYKIKYDYICGKDTLNIDGHSRGYLLKEGDTIIMDISLYYDGVWCDVTRTFFVGGVSERQRAVFNLIVSSIRAGERVLKSGVSAEEVYNAVNGEYLKEGELLVHHAGHKIGSRRLLQPQFLPQKSKRLKEFDLVAIESGLYKDFGIRLENDYLVKNNGCKNLFEQLMPFEIEEYVLK